MNPADLPAAGKLWTVFENGPASAKVDLLVISEGYAADQMDKFHRDVQRLVGRLFEYEPFKARGALISTCAPSISLLPRSGVNRARAQSFRRTPMSVEFNIFDSERYVLTYDDRALRNVASAAPYEFIEVLVNEEQYGGGGIFNFQATASVDHAYAEYVFVHEFGHHFAGLADEYYTSDVAYETGAAEHVEPWEPNATAMHDPSRLKWRDLVEPGRRCLRRGTRSHARSRAATRKHAGASCLRPAHRSRRSTSCFGKKKAGPRSCSGGMKFSGKVGAFEGASCEAKGFSGPRPTASCSRAIRSDSAACAAAPSSA